MTTLAYSRRTLEVVWKPLDRHLLAHSMLAIHLVIRAPPAEAYLKSFVITTSELPFPLRFSSFRLRRFSDSRYKNMPQRPRRRADSVVALRTVTEELEVRELKTEVCERHATSERVGGQA